MFVAICVTNPGSDYSTASTIGRMWPTAELVREHFEEAWAQANSSYYASYNKTPKVYGIAQVVEGIEVDQRMTFKAAPVDAFVEHAAKPAKAAE